MSEIKLPEAAPSPDQASSESQPVRKKRTGLAWLNAILLLLYGYGSGADIFLVNSSHGHAGMMFALIVTGTILVAGSLFGFLAALNPAHEMKRRLAKSANLIVLGVALLASLGPILQGTTAVSDFIISAFIALPAVLNLRAFWRPPAGKRAEVPRSQSLFSQGNDPRRGG
ncbi:MAG TPA: hypothetical protein VKV04_08655 [Verrucomicrobiae bacterium]|nr:hypothetical protein [Verrucomicrobiae bacterium]